MGELYNAIVRIDDDDYVHMNNELNINYCSPQTGMGGTLVVGGEETFQTAHEEPYIEHITGLLKIKK